MKTIIVCVFSLTYEVVVEAEHLVLVVLVALEFLLEGEGVAAVADAGGPAVHAVPVLRQERLNVDPVLLVVDRLRVVSLSAIIAAEFILLNVNEYLIGQAHVHERVDAPAEGLQLLCLPHVRGEVSQHEPVLSL